MSGYKTQQELKILKESRFDDLLCYECTMKRAGSMSGQGFTSFDCKSCNRSISYHNTGTPNYCKGCAYEKFCCQRCMQSLDKDLNA